MASSFGGGAPNKITKHRGKMQATMQAVKPAGILKKLSHSEKNSLDLDRGWEQQSTQQFEHHQWGGQYGSRAGSTKDVVSFAFPPSLADLEGGGGGAIGGGMGVIGGMGGAMGALGSSSSSSSTAVRTKFQHGRSASQASTGSNSRGAFVHPFQQTPRTSTPPLSYAASLASFDNNNARDYSPTITENEDDDGLTHPPSIHHPPPTLSQSNLRRPSLASQRTSSLSDVTSPPPAPLRVNTGRTTPALARRAPASLAASASQSDLHLHNALDSPSTCNSTTVIAPSITSPASSLSAVPMSPLRSSLEAAGFPRLRSRSELDTLARHEHIREARRKFEERERVKEEKHDREMIKKRERRDFKQASRIEKESRKSSISELDDYRNTVLPKPPKRPLPSRTSATATTTSTAAPVSSSADASATQGFWQGTNSSRDALRDELNEKHAAGVGFASRKYENVPDGQMSPPVFGPAPPPRRRRRALRTGPPAPQQQRQAKDAGHVAGLHALAAYQDHAHEREVGPSPSLSGSCDAAIPESRRPTCGFRRRRYEFLTLIILGTRRGEHEGAVDERLEGGTADGIRCRYKRDTPGFPGSARCDSTTDRSATTAAWKHWKPGPRNT